MGGNGETARRARTRRSTRPAPIALAGSQEVASCERSTTIPPGAPSALSEAQGAPASATPPAQGRRARRGLKRTTFQAPKVMPAPVRALWKSASAAERETAHRTATTVLKAWLGKSTREEAARELDLTPLRFWQISQQALAGLVAGCLKQPRFRGKVDLGPEAENRASLQRRIRVLEREVEAGRRLIEVLRELPGHREAAGRAGKEASRGRKRRASRRPHDGRATPAGAAATGGPATP